MGTLERLVYETLAAPQHAETIARTLRMSKPQTYQALERLKKIGLVEAERVRQSVHRGPFVLYQRTEGR